MSEQWRFIHNSYWYVPTDYLQAMQMDAENTTPTTMTDQTVWQITGYDNGYFWGNCAVLIYETGTQPAGPPQARRMLGSITPDGSVQISFMTISATGAATAIQGWGHMRQDGGPWMFVMQMASGITSLTTHWACMAATAPGQPGWQQLPGTDYSLPAFLEAAGFEVVEPV